MQIEAKFRYFFAGLELRGGILMIIDLEEGFLAVLLGVDSAFMLKASNIVQGLRFSVDNTSSALF